MNFMNRYPNFANEPDSQMPLFAACVILGYREIYNITNFVICIMENKNLRTLCIENVPVFVLFYLKGTLL